MEDKNRYLRSEDFDPKKADEAFYEGLRGIVYPPDNPYGEQNRLGLSRRSEFNQAPRLLFGMDSIEILEARLWETQG